MQLGHESSSLIAGDISAEEAKKKKASIVPITTVDRFCLERNISRVDVIKIDVESFEPQVVEGAEETLRKRHVKFLTYECLANCGGNASMALVEKLHSFGFVCYMAGTANIFARMTGCWNEKYKLLEQRSGAWEKWKKAYPNTERSEPAQRLGGNVFCGNQRRAPALTAMLEAHSLHTFANNRRGDVLNEQLLGRPVSVKNGKTIVLPDKNVGEAYTRRSGRDVSTGERLKLPL